MPWDINIQVSDMIMFRPMGMTLIMAHRPKHAGCASFGRAAPDLLCKTRGFGAAFGCAAPDLFCKTRGVGASFLGVRQKSERRCEPTKKHGICTEIFLIDRGA